ncbi:RNA-binding S4 domain-containing protein [Porcincola intestinalis]|jgi:ribosome-associated protein|uniref:RNA-binding S4 domain-containing protein n=1 Tax=Porcincola intestinalis TaxID=2606632 RepID=UPI0023F21DB7|nr:RNA-binding S4 domain-containing protein [Porcincola intestinalis]MCI6237759.1 RNA-binding S4 domain-containing protein [Lachnospiraceae bacterium]MCI6698105.1 RNA-binding S4 domain-containing protein [Lachnospiraceae bacterium]MCI6767174.1 RNA-binding S4 domain-containing protein [Lachnospiraceae bacterium]MCI7093638.1 RNA-binding S4 domain-containing protein [Lachnospiraceae bacterium]MDD7061173.1 RNA-binding S4 domain-containing protein [Porcincola intestinalis]
MREFQLHGEEDFIKLGQLLKAAGLVDSGVEAKYAIEEGKASVNGEVCAMRGKKIHAGDVVAFGGEEIRVR